MSLPKLIRFVLAAWLAKAPAERVRQLSADMQKALAPPEVRQRIVDQGGGGTAEAFTRFVSAERVRWAQVILTSGIKAE